MFLTTNKCKGIGECIQECPTGAIRLVDGKASAALPAVPAWKPAPTVQSSAINTEDSW